ncbi:nucleotidyltransferase domain-containing protein [Candidatus Woesearchaeota archaeon]|nr:nucleotidyltransferase domain-containing protein [Candidatus Woesearchaeota archaeon]
MNPVQYALLGTAHVLSSLDSATFGRVREVYLFGSTALGTELPGSDVDIFFSVDMPKKNQARLRMRVAALFEEFRMSRAGLQFKLAGIANEFSPIVGRLSEWTDILRSIAVSGIQLYGTARLAVKGAPWMVYSWEKAEPRGAFLNAVYGYNIKGKHYAGFLKRVQGLKVGKSAIAIPRTHSAAFEELLQKYRAAYTVVEFFR